MDIERLKKCRLAKGASQKDVATALGIDRTTYVKYEQGTSNPNVSRLTKLAEYLGVTPDYLLGKSDVYFDFQLFGNLENSKEENKDDITKKVLELLEDMPPEMQKAAIAQLEALAALNKKG